MATLENIKFCQCVVEWHHFVNSNLNDYSSRADNLSVMLWHFTRLVENRVNERTLNILLSMSCPTRENVNKINYYGYSLHILRHRRGNGDPIPHMRKQKNGSLKKTYNATQNGLPPHTTSISFPRNMDSASFFLASRAMALPSSSPLMSVVSIPHRYQPQNSTSSTIRRRMSSGQTFHHQRFSLPSSASTPPAST